MSGTTGGKWQNVSAGPRQVKDLQKAIGRLLGEGKTRDELYGVIGGNESRSAVMAMMGPVRAEVAALDEAIKERFGGQVTRENVRAIIAGYEEALPEARKSRPTDDNRRTPEEDAERMAAAAARDAGYQARRDAENAVLAQVMAKAPAGAKALIVAELDEDTSDPVTDYYGSRTVRAVAIGFRCSTREDFRALRAAAGQFPETAHLASPEAFAAWQEANRWRVSGDLEHRDNWSMGGGNYLSDHGSSNSGSGWVVRSRTLPATHAGITEDAVPDAPPAVPVPAAAPQRAAGGGKVTTIPGEVLAILATAETDGPRLRIPGRLSREDYVAVNRVLSAAGGSWSRREKAHVFAGDAGEILAGLTGAGTVERPQDNGWFPTPPAVAGEVLDAADLTAGMVVLEPSAGEGALAGPAAAAGCVVDCVEQDAGRVRVLIGAGFARAVTWADFLSVPPNPVYDRVVMNPPFADKADIAHVTHALRFLRPGGLLVAVMSAGVSFRDDRQTAAFREVVEQAGGDIEPLPEGSFRESGTDVRTVLVTIPAAAAPEGGASGDHAQDLLFA